MVTAEPANFAFDAAFLVCARDAGLETAEPDAKTLDANLPGDVPVTAWRRCEPPPLAWMLRHGEGAAVLGAVERMEAGCVPGATALACAEAVVAAADVSGDRLLGPAEIARIARGLGWMIAGAGGTAEGQGPRPDGQGDGMLKQKTNGETYLHE